MVDYVNIIESYHMKKITGVLSAVILIVFFNVANAQQKITAPTGRHTVSGTIKEKKTGEVLIGATVNLLELPKSGTISNAYGFYSLTAPAGTYTLVISFAGYQQDSIKINL